MGSIATSSSARKFSLPSPDENTGAGGGRVLALPVQHTQETWVEYVKRTRGWDYAVMSRARAAGRFRAIPYLPDISNDQYALLVRLALHSWSEGLGRYSPIEVSQRSIAALMGDASTYARGRAASNLAGLIKSGGLEVIEEGHGNRGSLVKVIGHCKKKAAEPIVKKKAATQLPLKALEDPETTTQPAAVAVPATASDHDSLVAAVRLRFANRISRQTVLELITSTSAANVQAQLDWFNARDSSWATRGGPVVAFIIWCRQELGEPETATRNRREAERRAEADNHERSQAEYQRWSDAQFKVALAALTPVELEEAHGEARKLGGSFVAGDTRAFRGMLRSVVLEHAGVPTREQWLEKWAA